MIIKFAVGIVAEVIKKIEPNVYPTGVLRSLFDCNSLLLFNSYVFRFLMRNNKSKELNQERNRL